MLKHRKRLTRNEKIAESKKSAKQRRKETEIKRKAAAQKLNIELNGY